MMVIVVVAVVVVGPKELPEVMRGLGRILRRLHYIKYALSKQFDDLMQETDLDELRKSVNFEVMRKEDGKVINYDEAAADADYLEDYIEHTQITEARKGVEEDGNDPVKG